MKITVETLVNAPVAAIWRAYSTPADIKQWNTASDDWHTTQSSVDLRVGGEFSSRMEAKDGSFGFDFAGTYTKVVPNELLEFSFGDRAASVEFVPGADGVTVRTASMLRPTMQSSNSAADGRPFWTTLSGMSTPVSDARAF